MHTQYALGKTKIRSRNNDPLWAGHCCAIRARRRRCAASGRSPGSRRACRRGSRRSPAGAPRRSEEHTSELQSRPHLVCRLLLEKKKKPKKHFTIIKKKKQKKNNRTQHTSQ